MSYVPAELIKKKKYGGEHTGSEIRFLIDAYTRGDIPDYQMSAWLMAVYFKGLTSEEIATYTLAMKNSGQVCDFSSLPHRVDKHSTGGVGDKTTLILAPIVAACGISVPMIAGRGLGHTGGTLDKLESINGFNVFLSFEEFHKHVSQFGLAIMGQTETLCPADRKLYALRDVTGTVDSLPLICGSIMSKKLAEDLTGLVLDVKYGSGAFMKTSEDAVALASLLKKTGEDNGVKVAALITNMQQPLGRFVGNSLEVKECVEILQGKSCVHGGIDYYADTRDLSLILAAHMIYLGGGSNSVEQAMDIANERLQSGAALEVFKELCRLQGAPNIEDYPMAQNRIAVLSESTGVISKMDTEGIGIASLLLGAGRMSSEDSIDPTAGIEMNCRIGQEVHKGDPLAYIYCDKAELLENSTRKLIESIHIEANVDIKPATLIEQVLI